MDWCTSFCNPSRPKEEIMDADLCKPRDGSAKAAIYAPMQAGVSNGGRGGGSTSRANRAGVGIILAMSPQGNL